MAVEWIHRQNSFLHMNISKHISSLDRITTTTTHKAISHNFTNPIIQKSINNASSPPLWNDSGTWITIVLYSIIFLLAVIGNLLVILTLIQSRRMRTITNVFLLNLAISDLLLGIFCMPFTLIGMLLRDFIFGEIMCKLLPYLQGECLYLYYLYMYVSRRRRGKVIWIWRLYSIESTDYYGFRRAMCFSRVIKDVCTLWTRKGRKVKNCLTQQCQGRMHIFGHAQIASFFTKKKF